MRRRIVAISMLAGVLATTPPTAGAGWDPAAFADEDTLDFLTVGPGQDEHWSKVWLVVIDDQVYIRLGSRAAGRMEINTTAPQVGVKIAAQQFDRVRTESTPDMAERVAEAMAEKYSTDIFVRFFSHPLTMRLAPEP